MLKCTDIKMYYICIWHVNSIYFSQFQVYAVTNIEVIRQNAFCHAKVILIGVSRDLRRQT